MNPILLDVHTPITTQRLQLRHPKPGDGKAINEAVLESFDELHEWMPWAEKRPSIDDSEEYARRAYASWILREDLILLILDKNTNELVGSTGLHKIKWEIPSFEIGYWARKSFTGQGFITEAVNALTLFTFKTLNAKRVEIRCDEENDRSSKIPKNLGFNLEGILRNEDRKSGNPQNLRNTLVFSRLDSTGLADLGVSWGTLRS